ncbi:hypothetical protein evm_006689 [Chilo suppressalis]|nr:hypothetical protein evm_006689 [Chilo suppressalis]
MVGEFVALNPDFCSAEQRNDKASITILQGLNVAVVMGGLPVEEDINKFKNQVHIVVGSPGRLRHLIQDKHIDVSSVRLLVLDEGDKLLDKSFQADINFIFSVLPHQKQVILSSATYTEGTKSFLKKYVKSAQHVCPDSNCILLGIEQKVTIVKYNANIVRQTQNRFEELLKILSKKAFKQCLIFCNYQARVTELHKLLMKHKWPVEQLYGQQEQTDRLGALKTLQDYKCRILIATDLAARGIDASNVDLVINFEPPFEWQTYLHRIGRAGRFGSYGMSITILSEGKEETKFKDMLHLLEIPFLDINSIGCNDNIEQTETNLPPFDKSNKTDDFFKYQELWNVFTGSKKENNIIENFETLCESFEGTKTAVVESFDDLLKSFQEKEVPIKSNEYQHLQITSEIIDKLNDTLNILTTANDTNENETGSAMELKSNENVNSNVKLNDFEPNHSSVTNLKLLNNYSILKKTSSYENEPSAFHKNDTKAISSTKAFMNAGLPLTFASSKDIKKGDSIKKQNRATGTEHKSEIFYHEEPSLSNEVKKFPSIKAKEKYSHELKQMSNQKYDVSNNGRRKPKTQPTQCKFEETDSDDSDCYVNENYIDWYKKLKFRMKQIELAVYVEEMTHLYE